MKSKFNRLCITIETVKFLLEKYLPSDLLHFLIINCYLKDVANVWVEQIHILQRKYKVYPNEESIINKIYSVTKWYYTIYNVTSNVGVFTKSTSNQLYSLFCCLYSPWLVYHLYRGEKGYVLLNDNLSVSRWIQPIINNFMNSKFMCNKPVVLKKPPKKYPKREPSYRDIIISLLPVTFTNFLREQQAYDNYIDALSWELLRENEVSIKFISYLCAQIMLNYRLVEAAFIWRNSKDGWDYWNRINLRWEAVYNANVRKYGTFNTIDI
jgi:hypothetical protein